MDNSLTTSALQLDTLPSIEWFISRINQHLNQTLGDLNFAQKNLINDEVVQQAYWQATVLTINELIIEKLHQSQIKQAASEVKSVNYLSLEYLMGRLLSNNLYNLNLYSHIDQALKSFDIELSELSELGADLALGNGGLGRLAACFLDSLATLDFNAMGYGIHYKHGLFKQRFFNGQQVEEPDTWREFGNPWEVCRQEATQLIPLFGHLEKQSLPDGSDHITWHPSKTLKGVPYDIPIVGYQSNTVNTLRLWECRADSAFDWDKFNQGDYLMALEQQVHAEIVSKVLYPNDEHYAGQELRFIQQYFFCACSIKDIIKRYQLQYGVLCVEKAEHFSSKVAIQLNDTHPTIAIVEFMRLLLDEQQFKWHDAWQLTRHVFAYTNHTLLPEALENWPVAMFERVLPRHLTIIYRINEEFLNGEVNSQWPENQDMRAQLSIIEEGVERRVRMAHLCVIASHKVNGVAKVHSALVKSDLFPAFNQLWPDKLINVTNGITPRRWLKACNPDLAKLIDKKIPSDWAKDLSQLSALNDFANDRDFQTQFMQVKHQNKRKLCAEILKLTGIKVSADAIFDVQIKRLHEYKRQHLNLLHILALYRRLLENPEQDFHPQVFIFGAKAAPAYQLAKTIIYAINKVAERINQDPRIKDKLKVVFLPNYRVSLAEKIIPAADISEQISTAGKEASGTGNMKLALNGAVTIGTLDGANMEIAEEVGKDNIFVFGLTVDEVKALNHHGYHPQTIHQKNEEIRACLDWLAGDYFTPGKPGALAALKHNLTIGGDPYKVLADFDAYSNAQQAMNRAYQDKSRWAKMAISNTASVGKFSSDRAILDYVEQVWQLTPVSSSSREKEAQ